MSLQSSKSTVILLPDDDGAAVKIEDNAEHLEAVLEPEEEDQPETGNDDEAPPGNYLVNKRLPKSWLVVTR